MVHHDPVTVQYLKVVANYEQTNGGGEEGEEGEKGEDRRGGSVLKKRKRNSAAAGEGEGLSGLSGMQGMQGRPSGFGIDEELEMVVVRDISRCTSTHILVILTCSFSPATKGHFDLEAKGVGAKTTQRRHPTQTCATDGPATTKALLAVTANTT